MSPQRPADMPQQDGIALPREQRLQRRACPWVHSTASQSQRRVPPHVVFEEARQMGIPLLPVDVNHSADHFSVEQVGQQRRRWGIRIGLGQVAQVGEELAAAILWERRGRTGQERPFGALEDFCARLRPAGLTWSATESLALAGAFDSLRPRLERRQILWRLHELWPLLGVSGKRRSRGRAKAGGEEDETVEQMIFDWEVALDTRVEVPALPTLDLEERLALDHRLLGMSARLHPMRLMRRELRRQGVRAIAELGALGEGRVVRVAGWPISAQRPPTAKGMGFVVLEDETGRLPIALPPKLAAEMHRRLRGARAITVAGRVEQVRWYRSLLAFDLQAIAA